MTFRTTISSKREPGNFLRQGLKSMFANYEVEENGKQREINSSQQEKKKRGA